MNLYTEHDKHEVKIFFQIQTNDGAMLHSACRRCKITLRGPWLQVPPIALSDISLMPCLAQSRMEQVPVWALNDKGDVLCRLGVSAENPAVRDKHLSRLMRRERP